MLNAGVVAVIDLFGLKQKSLVLQLELDSILDAKELD